MAALPLLTESGCSCCSGAGLGDGGGFRRGGDQLAVLAAATLRCVGVGAGLVAGASVAREEEAATATSRVATMAGFATVRFTHCRYGDSRVAA